MDGDSHARINRLGYNVRNYLSLASDFLCHLIIIH